MKFRDKNTKPLIFYKEISSPSIEDAIIKMDDWGQGAYDMFLTDIGPCGKRDGYVWLRIWGFEFAAEREVYDC